MTVPAARGLLRLDAVYELVLAALLAVAAATNPTGLYALPREVTPPLLVVATVVLVGAAVAIEALRRGGPRRGAVAGLAAANAVTAAALVAWALADPSFGTAARIVVALAGADLGALAAFQSRTLRSPTVRS